MKNEIWQWIYDIKDFIPEQVKINKKIWLKKGELFFETKDGKLKAFLLSDGKNKVDKDKIIESYLKFYCLITNNAPVLKRGEGIKLKSKNEFGIKGKIENITISSYLSNEIIKEIEMNLPKLVNFIVKLHDKYVSVVTDNKFIGIALDYFYEAQKKLVAMKDFLVP